MDAHIGYESAKPFELQWLENPTEPLSYRVTDRMRINKDAETIELNASLTLAGIPKDAFDYMLGGLVLGLRDSWRIGSNLTAVACQFSWEILKHPIQASVLLHTSFQPLSIFPKRPLCEIVS
jgi:hypothetical protein